MRDALIGGGFTYETSILKALLEKESLSHKIVLVVLGSGNLDRFRVGDVEVVRIGAFNVCSLSMVIAAAFRRLKWHPFIGLQLACEHWMHRCFARKLKRLGVQFYWSLNPFVYTMDIPYAVTMWDIEYRLQSFFPEVCEKGEWRNRERIYGEMLRRATYVVASNERGREQVTDYFLVPKERVVSLPHFTPGWALEAKQTSGSRLANELGLKRGNFVFYPAQFWPHKNHIRIIDSLALRKHQGKERLIAVFVGGDKGNRRYLQNETIRAGLQSDVLFPGFVDQADLTWLYQNALCLVYASMFGPENLPPLEAFQLGCPVICAKYDGAVAQLGNAALYFEPTDAKELAERIDEIREQNLANSLVTRGREKSANWTPKSYVDEVFRLLSRFEGVRRCWE